MPAKNFILFTVDDLRSLSNWGHFSPLVSAPNIQRLMDEGTTFTRAVTQVPLCNPSRSSVMTGQQPADTGILDNRTPWFERIDPAQTLPATLKAAGAYVAMFGKHFPTEFPMPEGVREQLFDEYRAGSGDGDRALVARDEVRQTSPFDAGRYLGPESALRDRIVTDAATKFLRNRAPDLDEPFFLGVGIYKPHLKWWIPSEYYDRYDPAAIRAALRQSLADGTIIPGEGEYFDVPGMSRPSPEHALIEGDIDKWADYIHAYLAAVSYSDAKIGEVLDTLAANPRLAAETSILLWSDHGYSLGDKDRWGKFTHWREATETPLIIVDPDRAGGRIANQVVSLVDIFPTVLDMMGLDTPAALDLAGESLTPILRNPTREWTDPETGRGVALTTIYGSFSIRADAPALGDMRYARYPDGGEELYRLASDPNEHRNLLAPGVTLTRAEAAAAAAMRAMMDDALDRADVLVSDGARPTIGTAAAEFLVAGPEGAHDLRGGAGNDTYILYGPATVTERTGQGFDCIVLLDAEAARGFRIPTAVEMVMTPTDMIGNSFRNRIESQLGGRLEGRGGDDALVTRGGPAELIGGNGDDTLTGGNYADALYGGDGADTLRGGGGADRLRGGDGVDSLAGGSGADIFEFAQTSHSSRRYTDTILDFEGAGAAGGDLIDLRRIDADLATKGDQAFRFGGSGIGCLWVVENGDRATILGNVDLDPEPEVRIRVEFAGPVGHLSAQDFLL